MRSTTLQDYRGFYDSAMFLTLLLQQLYRRHSSSLGHAIVADPFIDYAKSTQGVGWSYFVCKDWAFRYRYGVLFTSLIVVLFEQIPEGFSPLDHCFRFNRFVCACISSEAGGVRKLKQEPRA